MSVTHALRPFAVLSHAVNAAVLSMWRMSRTTQKRRAARVECERLEERRLFSTTFFNDGYGHWHAYFDYSFMVYGQGGKCETGHLMHATGYALGNGSSRDIHSWVQPTVASNVSSTWPVRYADGDPIVSSTDLSSAGFGSTWGQTRT